MCTGATGYGCVRCTRVVVGPRVHGTTGYEFVGGGADGGQQIMGVEGARACRVAGARRDALRDRKGSIEKHMSGGYVHRAQLMDAK